MGGRGGNAQGRIAIGMQKTAGGLGSGAGTDVQRQANALPREVAARGETGVGNLIASNDDDVSESKANNNVCIAKELAAWQDKQLPTESAYPPSNPQRKN